MGQEWKNIDFSRKLMKQHTQHAIHFKCKPMTYDLFSSFYERIRLCLFFSFSVCGKEEKMKNCMNFDIEWKKWQLLAFIAFYIYCVDFMACRDVILFSCLLSVAEIWSLRNILMRSTMEFLGDFQKFRIQQK